MSQFALDRQKFKSALEIARSACACSALDILDMICHGAPTIHGRHTKCIYLHAGHAIGSGIEVPATPESVAQNLTATNMAFTYGVRKHVHDEHALSQLDIIFGPVLVPDD